MSSQLSCSWRKSVGFVVVCSQCRMLIVAMMGKCSDGSACCPRCLVVRCCSVVFDTLVGVFSDM